MHDKARKFETLAIHKGQSPDPTTGAVMLPITLSTTFAQDGPGNDTGFDYSRAGNPTRNALEQCLASLEGATHGLAFASGCAAMTTILQTLKPGDHVVASDDVYGGTYRIFEQVIRPLGIDISWVDFSVAGALEEELVDRTAMVWVETPTNPLLKLADIEQLAHTAHNKGARVVVDNTFATPYLQSPFALGADVVVHSTTKYINGHSDVIGGFVAVNDDGLAERLRFLQKAVGAVPSPFDCFLTLRGVKTLAVRMDRHVQNATRLAAWLERHPAVEKVIYPSLDSHPQRALAQKQMRAGGGMISFVVRGGLAPAETLLRAVTIFTCAESLGGVESLIEHPAIMTHASVPKANREALGISDGLIRVSVGIEAADDLEQDLAQALERSQKLAT